MSLLDNLKQELIVQKSLLDQKGFTVNNVNAHPSPTDITNAIRTIDFNLDYATATEEDVKAGKTFYAKTGDLKTGTLDAGQIDELKNRLNAMISGVGNIEVYIPTDESVTQIRDYTYSILAASEKTLFYAHNLTIPSNIKIIYQKAFYGANITGTLTIPSTCSILANNSFEKSNIEEVVAYGGITSSSNYVFNNCPNLKKVTLHEPISVFGTNFLSSNSALEEVYFPSTLKELSSSTFYKTSNLKVLKLANVTPLSIASTTFSYCKNAAILVPYESFDSYYNSTNYRIYGNKLFGYGEFEKDEALITLDNGYSITWHTTLEDAQNSVNAISICPENCTLYGNFTPITIEDEEMTT